MILNEYKLTPIELLTPYANNARTHSDEQVSQIAHSITEFGFTNPVLIDEQGGIIAGHGRVLAAVELGLEVLPTITLTGLSELQKRAYVLADNKIAENAGWNDALLKVELDALELAGFDIDFIGFSLDDVVIDELNDNGDNSDNDKPIKRCPNCDCELG
jgi:ParB-like chromosome segregation protein Spo0J